jgi:hypothetical protein
MSHNLAAQFSEFPPFSLYKILRLYPATMDFDKTTKLITTYFLPVAFHAHKGRWMRENNICIEGDV